MDLAFVYRRVSAASATRGMLWGELTAGYAGAEATGYKTWFSFRVSARSFVSGYDSPY